MSSRNRGKESKDDLLFGNEKSKNMLKLAVEDLSYLLGKNYGIKSACELVGNRYKLNARQQKALRGMSVGQKDILLRKQNELQAHDLKSQNIFIDGFNLLIILESILSNAYVFKGLDDCYRDLSSIHGSYKTVSQTKDVMILVGKQLKELSAEKVIWVLDKPVSNSGKLKTLLYDIAQEFHFNWDVILEFNPDKCLVETNEIVITSDAWILNNCKHWFNMVDYLLKTNKINSSFIVKYK